jgi:hypothetical protein
MALNFEWDPNKAKSNREKHGIVLKRLLRLSEIHVHSPFLIPRIRRWETASSLLGVRTVENCSLWSIPKEATIFVLLARESPADENDGLMKKAGEKNNEMLPEYDFAEGVRGKYARRYARESNVVVLEPDVAKVFPNAEAVNASLRSLVKIIRRRKVPATK